MKENIKIGLLGVIALASVINIFQLSSISDKQEETSEASSAVVANNTATGNNPVVNPGMNNNTISTTVDNGQHNTASPATDMKKTTIGWGNMVHDFGKVKQDSENKYSFTFKNTGTEPLLVTNAVGSCGCTVPDYPKEPIAPGASATIDVVYKPGKQENQQEKTVTVTANTEPMQTTLKIRAFVEK